MSADGQRAEYRSNHLNKDVNHPLPGAPCKHSDENQVKPQTQDANVLTSTLQRQKETSYTRPHMQYQSFLHWLLTTIRIKPAEKKNNQYRLNEQFKCIIRLKTKLWTGHSIRVLYRLK